MSLLQVKHLTVRFKLPEGPLFAVKEIGFSLGKNEILGVVGESGSGKTQLFFSLFGLLAQNGKAFGEAVFEGQELLQMSQSELNQIRGKKVGFVFQDALSALHPQLKIEQQLCEVLEHHEGLVRCESRKRATQMLDAVHLPSAQNILNSYPHELSGGMRQRVLIAMALLCRPKLLIADEPTTALDVSIQAQILSLMRELQKEFGMAIALITHDLGVVAGMADRVMVMYGGHIMESGTVEDIFLRPKNPYTKDLLNSLPSHWVRGQPLKYIPGSPHNSLDMQVGCPFQDRCIFSESRCGFIELEKTHLTGFHFSSCPFQ